MSDKKRLFGTFGVRRVANEVLTPEFASRLAACYGSVVQGTVAVGGDTRTSSPMLMEAVKAGLLSSGCDVVDLGILPTPGVQYGVRKYYDGGVMITASHNPPKYNGIKFLDELIYLKQMSFALWICSLFLICSHNKSNLLFSVSTLSDKRSSFKRESSNAKIVGNVIIPFLKS